MGHQLGTFVAAGVLAVLVSSPAAAQAIFPEGPLPRFGVPPAVYPLPLRAPPFSRDAQIRERQVVTRQLAVLDWTRWQADAWALYGPEEQWAFGMPLTFAWDFPPVEQPIGYQRVYDGRGGYSSGPVYADQVAPPPQPVPVPLLPEAEVGERTRGDAPSSLVSSASRRPQAKSSAASADPAPRRLSW
jgi:hypothetical protein